MSRLSSSAILLSLSENPKDFLDRNGMLVRKKLNQRLVRKLFRYENGNLFWRVRTNSRICFDRPVGVPHTNGYVTTKIFRRTMYVHRLVYLFCKGTTPKYIDHINRKRDDNRIENLRECSHSDNHGNRERLGGIKFNEKHGNWKARITKNKTHFWLGTFPTKAEAVEAYNKASKKLFGSFARERSL